MEYLFVILAGIVAIIGTPVVLPALEVNLSINIQKETYYKFIVIGCLLIMGVFAFNNKTRTVPQDSQTIQRNMQVQDAFRHAKAAVKEQLKAPSTAKFADGYDKESKYKINEDESVVIQSYVDAQNSFGAMIRTHYRCTVDKYGKVSDLITW